MKIQAPFKNIIPFKEQPQVALEAYLTKKNETHSREMNAMARVTDSPERNLPFFLILNGQQLPVRLRYTDVASTLVRLVVLLYMKLSEVNQLEDTNRSMFDTLASNVMSMDKEIVDKVLGEVCADLNVVARRKTQLRLF